MQNSHVTSPNLMTRFNRPHFPSWSRHHLVGLLPSCSERTPPIKPHTLDGIVRRSHHTCWSILLVSAVNDYLASQRHSCRSRPNLDRLPVCPWGYCWVNIVTGMIISDVQRKQWLLVLMRMTPFGCMYLKTNGARHVVLYHI